MAAFEIRAARKHVRRTSTPRPVAKRDRGSHALRSSFVEHVAGLRHCRPCERVNSLTLGQHNKTLRVSDLRQVGEERA